MAVTCVKRHPESKWGTYCACEPCTTARTADVARSIALSLAANGRRYDGGGIDDVALARAVGDPRPPAGLTRDETREAVRALVKAGHTRAAVSARFGLSNRTVERYTTDLPSQFRRSAPGTTAARIAELLNENPDLTVNGAAGRLGLSRTSGGAAYRKALAAGLITTPRKGGRKPNTTPTIARILEDS